MQTQTCLTSASRLFNMNVQERQIRIKTGKIPLCEAVMGGILAAYFVTLHPMAHDPKATTAAPCGVFITFYYF